MVINVALLRALVVAKVVEIYPLHQCDQMNRRKCRQSFDQVTKKIVLATYLWPKWWPKQISRQKISVFLGYFSEGKKLPVLKNFAITGHTVSHYRFVCQVLAWRTSLLTCIINICWKQLPLPSLVFLFQKLWWVGEQDTYNHSIIKAINHL